MKYILALLASMLIISCSEDTEPLNIENRVDLFEHNDEFYLFDGEFYLSQNWYSPRDSFDMSECDDYAEHVRPSCLMPITIMNNTFDFIDYYGEIRTCTFYQNQDLPYTYESVFLRCTGVGHDSTYSVELSGNRLLIQEFPLYKTYKYLLETDIKDDLAYITSTFNDIGNLSSRNRELIEQQVVIDRNLTLSSDNFRWLVYSDDIILNDGSGGEFAGEVLGVVTCNFLLQLPIDCSGVAGTVGRDLTENNGETITQNLCVSYDAINNDGYIDHYIWVCEKFSHPNNVDFSKYIPRYFSNPEVYFYQKSFSIK